MFVKNSVILRLTVNCDLIWANACCGLYHLNLFGKPGVRLHGGESVRPSCYCESCRMSHSAVSAPCKEMCTASSVALFLAPLICAPLISARHLHYNIMFMNKSYLFEFIVYCQCLSGRSFCFIVAVYSYMWTIPNYKVWFVSQILGFNFNQMVVFYQPNVST